jgi:hypothetical protein
MMGDSTACRLVFPVMLGKNFAPQELSAYLAASGAYIFYKNNAWRDSHILGTILA